jgi:hypothetical protein
MKPGSIISPKSFGIPDEYAEAALRFAAAANSRESPKQLVLDLLCYPNPDTDKISAIIEKEWKDD